MSEPVRVRGYEPRDLEELVRLHQAQGFGYELPDLNDGLFVVKLVATDEADKPTMAILLRLTAEAYLLHDPKAGTPKERWRQLIWLHEAARMAAKRAGLEDVYAFLPPEIEKRFRRRLFRLGWKQPWAAYQRMLGE